MTDLTNKTGNFSSQSVQRLEDVRQRPFWRRPWVIHVVWQMLAISFILYVAWSIVANVSTNLPRSNIGFGLDFLSLPTRFEMGPNYLDATAKSPIWLTFAVGFINTVRVSILGIICCTFLGLVVALARLSENKLVSNVALVYTETVRNIPLLLQMLFWYGFSTLLPFPGQALNPAPGVFVSNRGIYMPSPVMSPLHYWGFVGLLLGIVAAFFVYRFAQNYRKRTGTVHKLALAGMTALIGLPLAMIVIASFGMSFDVPELKGFNFLGGTTITPEFVAVLVSLSVYQSGFAAETIRSGIMGVRKGQLEAARSLGLPGSLVLSKVVLPQAMRIIVPPMAGQYMSLTKNSSLAVVIGYPELVRVSTAVISETGRAIECITILMAIYLCLSLLTSAFMNWYNARIAFVEK
jgi:general L-amino acid transport system permease protein